MARLTIFAKGNVDVHDSLHSCKIGGKLLFNGINEILRESHPGDLVRVRHETWSRSDALMNAGGAVPAALQERALPLGAHPARTQFSTALFESDADVRILSVQPDLMTGLARHRTENFPFYPHGARSWPAADRQWLHEHFVHVPDLDAAESMRNFSAIIARLRARSGAPILVFNASAIVPGETVHCYQGLEQSVSTRTRRYNIALTELSETTGISIVDVDTIIGRAGADRHKLDSAHLTPAGYRLVAAEVVRILADLGVLSPQHGAACPPA